MAAEQSLSDDCLKLPVKELSQSTRKMLASYLDVPTEAVNKDYITQNWTGLAELMNFDFQEVKNFEIKDKTLSLFQAFSLRPGTRVRDLWEFIHELERYDIIQSDVVIKKLETDCRMFLERERLKQVRAEETRDIAHQSRPVQVQKVSSAYIEEPDYELIDAQTNEYEEMVVGDVESGETQYFDAFVSYCHDDFPFVQEMIRMLEHIHGIKLCLNARDLLAGHSEHFVTARLIADRCRKVIMVMSPSFLRSPECEFQVKVALSLSPGAKRRILIPIMFKYSRMPLVLQHVCLVDYTKSDLAEWFWGRLAASLKESRKQSRAISSSEMDTLASLRMNLDRDNKVSDQPDINTTEIGRQKGLESSGEFDSEDYSSGKPCQVYIPNQQHSTSTRPSRPTTSTSNRRDHSGNDNPTETYNRLQPYEEKLISTSADLDLSDTSTDYPRSSTLSSSDPQRTDSSSDLPTWNQVLNFPESYDLEEHDFDIISVDENLSTPSQSSIGRLFPNINTSKK